MTSISGPAITVKISVSALTIKYVFRQKHAIKLTKKAINKTAVLIRRHNVQLRSIIVTLIPFEPPLQTF